MNIADLRFAFQSGVLSAIESIQNGQVPNGIDSAGVHDWLEEQFQEWYRSYSHLQMALGTPVVEGIQ
jgi:hypothetical protein